MRRIVSVTLEFPDIDTETLRASVAKVIRESLNTEVYDVFDSYDTRLDAAAVPNNIFSPNIQSMRIN